MTGMQQILLGGGVVISFTVNSVTDVRASPITAVGSVTFDQDGLIGYVGNGSNGSARYANPPLPGIGNFYWVKIVVNSGTAPAGSAVNTVLALSTSRTWSWTSTAGQTKSANCTISVYADAAGTILLASSTFPVQVEST